MEDQDWGKNESVRAHIPRVLDFARYYLDQHLSDLTREAESPIEAIFSFWWHVCAGLIPGVARSLTLHHQFGLAPINGKSYRPDFVVWPSDLDVMNADRCYGVKFKAVVIEVDGHEFHERTKEQVIERNERDRNLQDAGYHVMHFSGAELHRDPSSVVQSAILAAAKAWFEFGKSVNQARQAATGREAGR